MELTETVMRSMGIGATFKDYVSFFTFVQAPKSRFSSGSFLANTFSRFQDFCYWIHGFLHLPSVRLCMEVKSISVGWSPLAGSLCILQLTISRIFPQVDCVWFWYSSRDRFSDCRSLGFCAEMVFCYWLMKRYVVRSSCAPGKFFVFSKSGGTIQLTLSRILPQVDCVWFW